MTDDGVNDLLAMRQADCSAAMGNGSDAAKQTAQLVLLDSDFAVLRDVISEGRRVINNLTKSAGVFFIERVEIFPEKQPDGRILKHIDFKFPVYYNDQEFDSISWEPKTTGEPVCLLTVDK